MKKRRKIHEVDSTNDIKYRGPLTYQHFRIAAWVLLALSQIALIISIGMTLRPAQAEEYTGLYTCFSVCGEIATPLLLIANFAVILTARAGYKKLLLRFGGLSLGAVLLFALFYERYAVGFLSVAVGRESAQAMLDALLSGNGYVAFNLFLDLFLCTLVMYFLNYTPKKVFTGKKLIIFRLFVIFPIAYEAVSVTLKILASLGRFSAPPMLFPFLTTKPPMGFIMFVALALFIKRRERKYIKKGRTVEEYREFLATNTNSWHFSVHSAIIMAVVALIDLVLLFIGTLVVYAHYFPEEESIEALLMSANTAGRWGLGATVPLIIIAPVMLLFSYNRAPKYPKLDTFIPLGGVALILFVLIEGFYQALTKFA